MNNGLNLFSFFWKIIQDYSRLLFEIIEREES